MTLNPEDSMVHCATFTSKEIHEDDKLVLTETWTFGDDLTIEVKLNDKVMSKTTHKYEIIPNEKIADFMELMYSKDE